MEYGGGRPVLIRHFHNHSDYNEHPLRKIYGNIFYRSATMIGCSESVTNSIKRDFPKIDVRCVNNAISFSRLDEYEVIGLDQGISVMMFGADFERKGVDITYKAINDLVNKGYQINLYIVCSINEDICKDKLKKVAGTNMLPKWVHFCRRGRILQRIIVQWTFLYHHPEKKDLPMRYPRPPIAGATW